MQIDKHRTSPDLMASLRGFEPSSILGYRTLPALEQINIGPDGSVLLWTEVRALRTAGLDGRPVLVVPSSAIGAG